MYQRLLIKVAVELPKKIVCTSEILAQILPDATRKKTAAQHAHAAPCC